VGVYWYVHDAVSVIAPFIVTIPVAGLLVPVYEVVPVPVQLSKTYRSPAPATGAVADMSTTVPAFSQVSPTDGDVVPKFVSIVRVYLRVHDAFSMIGPLIVTEVDWFDPV
jgi:hypothetical protein